MSMNKFIGIGRWSKEIELRYTPQGKAVASSTLAINEKYNGNENTTFLSVVMWGNTAEIVSQHSGKGRLISIEGRLQVRNYEKDGRKIYVTEIIASDVRFLDSKGGQADNKPDPFADSKPMEISDSDLPF